MAAVEQPTTPVDDLRARYRNAASLATSLSHAETQLAAAFREATAVATAKLSQVPADERGEANIVFEREQQARATEYARQADDVSMRRRVAHAERCRLEAELENAEMIAAAGPHPALGVKAL